MNQEQISQIKRAIVREYPKATLRSLAIKHGVSHERVRKWLREEGVKIRRQGQPSRDRQSLPAGYREKEVVDALLQGITASQIARHLKVSTVLIRKIARTNGLVQDDGNWRRG